MATKKPAKKASEPKPMDETITELPVGEQQVTKVRPCWAIKQLVAEVTSLFPETVHEVTDYNDRGVGLGVRFTTQEAVGLRELLSLVESDPRVKDVIGDDGQSLRILFHNSARTQDLRDSFGVDEAWDILEDQAEDEGWYDERQHEIWCDGTQGCGMAGCEDFEGGSK